MINFKLKSFPHVSETFIVSNIVYAKQKGFEVKIYVDKYLGLENSSQAELLKENQIESDVIPPQKLSRSILKKGLQVLVMLSHWRVLTYVFPYYKLKRKRNLTPLITLYQYRNLGRGLIHVHFNNALKPIVELAKIGFAKPRCIITFHGYDAFLDSKESFQKQYGTFYRKHVVAITVNSNYLKQEVTKLGVNPSLVHVIPIGIDTSKFLGQPKTLPNQKPIQLLTVGRLIQLKGHVYAIRALKLLIEKGFDLEYILIGDGNTIPELKKEVENLGLEDIVHFKGAKSQVEVIEYIKKADVFVMPSTYDNKTKRREAFGLVSVEAQAMGLPVVGFNSGGFPDTIIEGKTGFAVEDRNVEALADAIEKLLVDPTRFERMSKAAIQYAQTFDLQFTTQKYLDLYKSTKA